MATLLILTTIFLIVLTLLLIINFTWWRIHKTVNELKHDWKEAWELSSKEFLKRYAKELKRFSIGTSLSPEHFGSNDQTDIDKIMKFMKNDLSMKTVRFGIRWNHAVDQSGTIDLSYYKPWLDALIAHQFVVILNIGPIKVFRWPEEHIPESVTHSIKRPHRFFSIRSGSSIAQEAYLYLKNLCAILKKNYPEVTKHIQLDNEPFTSFGQFGWRLSDRYLSQCAKIINETLHPESTLVNTPAAFFVHHALSFVDHIKATIGVKNVILGLNYYYQNPYLNHQIIKFLFGEWFDAYAAFEIFNGYGALTRFNKQAEEKGIQLMITELQMEEWGNYILPADSVNGLMFALLRTIRYFPEKKNVLVWGVEGLAHRSIAGELSEQQKKMIDLIREVNDKE